jgi:hypothetical protein
LAAIRLTDWLVAQQLAILYRGRETAREAKRNDVLALIATKPLGITATDVYRRRIVHNAAQAHRLLDEMATAGLLTATAIQPTTGGHILRRYTFNRQTR